jgi:hypothetical protein
MPSPIFPSVLPLALNACASGSAYSDLYNRCIPLREGASLSPSFPGQIESSGISLLFIGSILGNFFFPPPDPNVLRDLHETYKPMNAQIYNNLKVSLQKAHSHLQALGPNPYSWFYRDQLAALEKDLRLVFSHKDLAPTGRVKSLRRGAEALLNALKEELYGIQDQGAYLSGLSPLFG